MEDTEYKCAKCNNIYTKERSDEEAKKEALEIHGEIPFEDMVVVCDDCFKRMKYQGLF